MAGHDEIDVGRRRVEVDVFADVSDVGAKAPATIQRKVHHGVEGKAICGRAVVGVPPDGVYGRDAFEFVEDRGVAHVSRVEQDVDTRKRLEGRGAEQVVGVGENADGTDRSRGRRGQDPSPAASL